MAWRGIGLHRMNCLHAARACFSSGNRREFLKRPTLTFPHRPAATRADHRSLPKFITPACNRSFPSNRWSRLVNGPKALSTRIHDYIRTRGHLEERYKTIPIDSGVARKKSGTRAKNFPFLGVLVRNFFGFRAGGPCPSWLRHCL